SVEFKKSNAWILKAKAPRKWRWPVKGRVLNHFGAIVGTRKNIGIDIAAREGTPIYASAKGMVSYADNGLPGYGNLIILRHGNSYMTAYAHAKSILVKQGDRIKAGQHIAYVGKTGRVKTPRLHFEIRKKIKPLNPLKFLPKRDRR
ncbi:murein hydrolase activator EnvC family protein, partial [Magnetococcales bacterium HHB-1]